MRFPTLRSMHRCKSDLSPGRRGITLIELLIVVAILAITSVTFAHLIQTASMTNRKSDEARQAVRIARNEFETLRASRALAPGSRSVSESRLPTNITVGAASEDGLAPVTVAVTIGAPLQTETIQFHALIPTASEAGS